VEALPEDRALALPELVEPARDAHQQALHGLGEPLGVRRFKNQMQVIRQHREVDDLAPKALLGRADGLDDAGMLGSLRRHGKPSIRWTVVCTGPLYTLGRVRCGT
jgi:hypothetical protein